MESKTDIEQYIQDCRINYSSPFNDGYTRNYYKGELLRLKAILDESLSETEDILNGENNISK
tara:strand:- start:1353 stop:1538 length:186 start_codon:yes stop_codon:yes gene_type:complete